MISPRGPTQMNNIYNNHKKYMQISDPTEKPYLTLNKQNVRKKSNQTQLNTPSTPQKFQFPHMHGSHHTNTHNYETNPSTYRETLQTPINASDTHRNSRRVKKQMFETFQHKKRLTQFLSNQKDIQQQNYLPISEPSDEKEQFKKAFIEKKKSMKVQQQQQQQLGFKKGKNININTNIQMNLPTSNTVLQTKCSTPSMSIGSAQSPRNILDHTSRSNQTISMKTQEYFMQQEHLKEKFSDNKINSVQEKQFKLNLNIPKKNQRKVKKISQFSGEQQDLLQQDTEEDILSNSKKMKTSNGLFQNILLKKHSNAQNSHKKDKAQTCRNKNNNIAIQFQTISGSKTPKNIQINYQNSHSNSEIINQQQQNQNIITNQLQSHQHLIQHNNTIDENQNEELQQENVDESYIKEFLEELDQNMDPMKLFQLNSQNMVSTKKYNTQRFLEIMKKDKQEKSEQIQIRNATRNKSLAQFLSEQNLQENWEQERKSLNVQPKRVSVNKILTERGENTRRNVEIINSLQVPKQEKQRVLNNIKKQFKQKETWQQILQQKTESIQTLLGDQYIDSGHQIKKQDLKNKTFIQKQNNIINNLKLKQGNNPQETLIDSSLIDQAKAIDSKMFSVRGMDKYKKTQNQLMENDFNFKDNGEKVDYKLFQNQRCFDLFKSNMWIYKFNYNMGKAVERMAGKF